MTITYRKLLPTDAGRLRDHLLALTADERRMRFHGQVADSVIDRHCAGLDWFRTVVVGCFVDGRLHGAAEIAFDRSLWPSSAEVAVTVEAPWQGRGIGTELTRRAVTVARNRGAYRLIMLCLIENLRMRMIARKLRSALNFEDGTVEADLDLRGATPWTLFEELFQDGTAGWMAMTERFAALTAA